MDESAFSTIHPQIRSFFGVLEEHFGGVDGDESRIAIAGSFATHYFIETQLRRSPGFVCDDVTFFLADRITDEAMKAIARDFKRIGGRVASHTFFSNSGEYEVVPDQLRYSHGGRVSSVRELQIWNRSQWLNVRLKTLHWPLDCRAYGPFWKRALETLNVSVAQVAIHSSYGHISLLNDDVQRDLVNNEFSYCIMRLTCPEKGFYQIVDYTRKGFDLRAIVFKGEHEARAITAEHFSFFDFEA